MVCDSCRDIKLVKRKKYETKDAVYLVTECPKHNSDFPDEHYYDIEGKNISEKIVMSI